MLTLDDRCDDYLVSPRWLRRVADWWDRRPPTTADILAAVDQDGHVIRSAAPGGRYPMIFLARARTPDARLDSWTHALRGAHPTARGWYGVSPDLLRVLADEADAGAMIFLDAPLRRDDRIRIRVIEPWHPVGPRHHV